LAFRQPLIDEVDIVTDSLSSDEWLQTRPGERCLIRISAEQTQGAYSVVEILSSPGDSTPLHVHENEDEHILVLEGTAMIWRGSETLDAAAGEMVCLPRNIHHAWGNASASPLRIVVACRPGGVEEVLRRIAAGDVIAAVELAARLGVRFVGPPPLDHERPAATET
jgi:quercetin dioxygenase-like cupin family protein